MKWSQITDVGWVRTTNEDSMCAHPEIGLFGVADGMGGHKAGEVASSTALQYLVENLSGYLKENSDQAGALMRALDEANLRVFRLSTEFTEFRGMGTTVTVGLFVDGELLIGHIGDSRAYLIRQNNIIQLTNDHSLVAEMVRGGGITEEQAQNHPRRNVLTRAMGTAPTVMIDLYRNNIQPGDRFLFCTDGMSNHLSPADITDNLKHQEDLEQGLKELLKLALDRGGLDNITMVIIEVD